MHHLGHSQVSLTLQTLTLYMKICNLTWQFLESVGNKQNLS